jgi:type II secretory pathway pseudopilin PulG
MIRLRAFTIIELIVGMIISSIVIGISFFTLILLRTQVKDYTGKSDRINSFLLFKKTISQDFRVASSVKDSLNRIQLYGTDKNRMVLEYVCDTNKIIRYSPLSKDTFYFNSTLARIEPVAGHETLIKWIQWNIFLNDQIIPFSVLKDYTALELMNAETADQNE